jgi:hypothetical protein
MLGAVLKQYNGAPASRIRPQSLKANRRFLQSRISLRDPTILSSKIQARAYNDKRCHNSSSGQTGKEGVERKSYIATSRRRLDNAKNKRFALFIMNNLRRQAGDLFRLGKIFASYNHWLC